MIWNFIEDGSKCIPLTNGKSGNAVKMASGRTRSLKPTSLTCVASLIAGLFVLWCSDSIAPAYAADRFTVTWNDTMSKEADVFFVGTNPRHGNLLAKYFDRDQTNPNNSLTRRLELVLKEFKNGTLVHTHNAVHTSDTSNVPRTEIPGANWQSHRMIRAGGYANVFVESGELAKQRNILFQPNSDVIKDEPDGTHIRVELLMTYQFRITDSPDADWITSTASGAIQTLAVSMFRINSNSSNINWAEGTTGTIAVDSSQTSYSELSGTLTPTVFSGEGHESATWGILSTETNHNGEESEIGNQPAPSNVIDGSDWNGNEFISGDDHNYGYWAVSSDFDHFRFVPNKDGINNSPANLGFSSTLYLTVGANNLSQCINCPRNSENTMNTPIRVSSITVSFTPAVPTLLLSPGGTQSEDGTVEFSVVAYSPPLDTLDVLYTPSNIEGNYLDEAHGAPNVTRITTLTFTLKEGATLFTSTISVPVTDRNLFYGEDNGKIEIVLADSDDYELESGTIRAEAPVVEKDRPILSVEAGPEVPPGDMAEFRIESNIGVLNPLSLTFTPSDVTGSYLDRTGLGNIGATVTRDLTFNAVGNKFLSTLSLPTSESSDSPTVAGAIQVLLINDPNNIYTLHETVSKHSAQVSINESPGLHIEISSAPTAIDEGESATFTLAINSNARRNVSVKYIADNVASGSFLDLDQHQPGEEVTAALRFVNSGSGSNFEADLALHTSSDNVDTEHGQISLTLVDDPAYEVDEFSRSIAVSVRDIDIPVLSVSDAADTFSGNRVRFTVTADILPRTAISVAYVPSDKESDYLTIDRGASGTARYDDLKFSRVALTGQFEATIEIETKEFPSNVTGVIQLELKDQVEIKSVAGGGFSDNSEDYDLEDGATTATVNLRTLATLSIAVVNSPIAEGAAASFILTSSNIPANPLNVSYIPTNIAGNFLDTTPTDENVRQNSGDPRSISLMFAPTDGVEYTANFTIPTIENNVDEEDGEILVRLAASELYAISEDNPSVTVRITDDDIPEIGIAAAPDVVRGEPIGIILSADIMPRNSIQLAYTPTNMVGSFLALTAPPPGGETLPGSGETRTADLNFQRAPDGNSFTALILIPTLEESPNETSGQITVELNDVTSPNYKLDYESAQVSVEILDNTFPSISMSDLIRQISEGDTATFEIMSNLTSARTLEVTYRPVNSVGNFLSGSGETASGMNRTQMLNFSQVEGNEGYTTSIEIQTNPVNGLDEDNGEIVVELVPTDEYAVNLGSRTGKIQVLDADSPVLSIEAQRNTIAGGDAVFWISSMIRPKDGFMVRYVPTNSSGSSFLNPVEGPSGEPRISPPLSFAPTDNGQYLGLLRVSTVVSPSDIIGAVQVTLTIPQVGDLTDYSLGNKISAQTTVVHECVEIVRIPCVSIIGKSPFVGGDNRVEFQVNVEFASNSALDVQLVATRGEMSMNCEVVLPAFQTSISGSCPVPEGNSPVELSPAVSRTYTVAQPQIAIFQPSIQSNPWISIRIEEDSIAEGTSFTVVGESIPPVPGISTIPITFDDPGMWFDDSENATLPTEITLTNGRGQFFVPTINRAGNEDPDGSITVAVTPSQNDSYKTHSSIQSDVVTILTGIPTLSFTAERFGGLESDRSIRFTVELSRDTTDSVLIQAQTIELNNRGEFALEGADYSRFSRFLHFEAGSRTRNIDVPIIDDNELESEEQFELMVSIPRQTSVKLPDGAFSISAIGVISDDEGLPKLSIEPFVDENTVFEDGVVTIFEGMQAVFTITASPIPTSTLNVGVKVSDPNNFVLFRVGGLNITQEKTQFRVYTDDDNEVEMDGELTVEVVSRPNAYLTSSYELTRATVLVKDDDAAKSPSLTAGTQINRVSVANSVLRQILQSGSNQSTGDPSFSDGSPSATVSIESEMQSISEGEPARFVIRSSQAKPSSLSVKIEITQHGEFITGSHTRTINLHPAQREASFQITTIDDDVAEDDGRVIATVREDNGYLVDEQNSAYVAVSDAEDRNEWKQKLSSASREILPNLLAVVGSGSLNSVSDRTAMAFSGEGGTKFELGGQSSIKGVLSGGGEMLNEHELSLRTVLNDTKIAVSVFPDGSDFGTATVWGLGDNLEMTEIIGNGSRSWKGEMFTGQLGFDTAISENVVIGLSTMITDAELDYRYDDGEVVNISTQTTGIHPYFGLSTNDGRSRLEVAIGYGDGGIGIDRNREDAEFQNSSYIAMAAGGNVNLLSGELFGGRGELDLATQTWQAQQDVEEGTGFADGMQINAGQIRLAMEGTQEYGLQTGDRFLTRFSAGFLHETDGTRSTVGLEVADHIKYEYRSDLDISGTSRILMTRRNPLGQWNLGVRINQDLGGDSEGLLLTVHPNLENAKSKHEVVFNHLNPWNEFGSGVNGSSVETEVGYGIKMQHGRLTPFSRFEFGESDQFEFNFGSRLKMFNHGSASLTIGGRTASNEVATDRFVKVRSNYNW